MESGFNEKRTGRLLRMGVMKSTKRRLDTCKGLGAWGPGSVSSFIPIMCLFLEAAAMIRVDLS